MFNPKNYPGRPWMHEFAQAPCAVPFDTFIRVYFSCRPQPDPAGNYVSYAAYIDLSKKNLFHILEVASQPILALGERGTFDEFGIYPVSVIRHDHEFLAFYGGWTRCESVPFNVAIGVARSKDGRTFERVGNGPVLSFTQDEPFILSSPKIRRFGNRWYLFYIAGKKWLLTTSRPEPVYKIRMAVSVDGFSWEKINRDLVEVRLEEDECQASPDVFYYSGKYHMFFSYRYSLNYRNRERGYRIGYAVSDDLFFWSRKDDMAGIDVSDEGWDSEMISYPNVFQLDNELYMLYLGNGVGRCGFGLAKLEK
ncbi:MAG: hypothetical protein N2044_09990 [Cyclobacteriaceae bacterium]|nr:hypothetical protein [Cyclobacteriaceae bacterium]